MKGICKAVDIDLLDASPMAVDADADGKGWCAQGVQEASLWVCSGVLLHQASFVHPDVKKPYPGGAAEQTVDGIGGASRSQKSLLAFSSCHCIGPMFVQQTCM